jgi:DNA-binding CsgD family transcriptional regulator
VKVITESQMTPLWTQIRPGHSSLEWRALEAFIEAHIANPSLNLCLSDWETLINGGEIPGMAQLKGLVQTKQRNQDPHQLMREAGLTEKEQRAMELAGRFGNTREIAHYMGIAQATALTKLERGREKIKRRLRGGRNWAKPA